MAMSIQVPQWLQRPISEELDMPVPIRPTKLTLTIIRKAAWAGILVPTCECKEREFVAKKDWLHCTTCDAPVRPLDGVEQEAESIDEALIIALSKVEQ